MIEGSVVDAVAERVERELERVRAARPHIASRVERAGNILVTHLSCRRQRLVRVMVDRDGRPRFLVSGSKGAVYAVDPADGFSCTCPDHHRRGAACKHGIAAYVLWRASRPATAVPTTPAEQTEEIPSEILAELNPATIRRSLRGDRVRHDGELPVVDPEVLDRMAERMGVA